MFGDSPVLEVFWAAGLSFSKGHMVARVPYDCCLPMMFQGEETSLGLRAWTHGGCRVGRRLCASHARRAKALAAW